MFRRENCLLRYCRDVDSLTSVVKSWSCTCQRFVLLFGIAPVRENVPCFATKSVSRLGVGN